MPMPAQDPAPRLLAETLRRALRTAPVVVVSGARQTGKSTLVRAPEIADGRRYLTLDDADTLERALAEPRALVSGNEPLTLDEVQRAPDLLRSVKRAVDERRTPGRFLLTGSADLLLMQRVTESLAGRAVHLTLWPMTRGERAREGRCGAWDLLFATPPDRWPAVLADLPRRPVDWRAAARVGGFPEPALHLRDAAARDLWFEGYTRTYLERDVRDLARITSLVDFRRLLRACALRIAAIAQQTELGRDVGLSQSTVHRHLNLLEASYQVVRLPAYAVHRTKRLMKSPQLHLGDTGLAMHLAGETEPRGEHLENLVVLDLLAWRGAAVHRPEILHWRTSNGEEVDIVVEAHDRLLPIEVKATRHPTLHDARGLRAFREEYGNRVLGGLLLHGGETIETLADGVVAAPWWRVL